MEKFSGFVAALHLVNEQTEGIPPPVSSICSVFCNAELSSPGMDWVDNQRCLFWISFLEECWTLNKNQFWDCYINSFKHPKQLSSWPLQPDLFQSPTRNRSCQLLLLWAEAKLVQLKSLETQLIAKPRFSAQFTFFVFAFFTHSLFLFFCFFYSLASFRSCFCPIFGILTFLLECLLRQFLVSMKHPLEPSNQCTFRGILVFETVPLCLGLWCDTHLLLSELLPLAQKSLTCVCPFSKAAVSGDRRSCHSLGDLIMLDSWTHLNPGGLRRSLQVGYYLVDLVDLGLSKVEGTTCILDPFSASSLAIGSWEGQRRLQQALQGGTFMAGRLLRHLGHVKCCPHKTKWNCSELLGWLQ